MTDLIEAHGGFVDKYFGDAIVAVFGAPLDDPHHATNAVRAALRCAAALGTLDRVTAALGAAVRQRIGLNSGAALVGNIGSRRRFNYTVMGDVVNLASRLEGANKLYGTTVLASHTTDVLARAHAYAEGLTRYRARDFAAAAEQFARVAAEDPPSALLLARVRELAREPPGPQWEPVTAQEEK
jgi:class 3 adenylate cyclase